MTTQYPTCRNILAAGCVLVSLAATASAQDFYKARAEMYSSSAANKQADAAIIGAVANYGKSLGETAKLHAETAKIHQEIREKAAQNDLLETDTYYKKKAQYQAYRDTQRPKPVSPGQYAERARRTAPAQLTSYHFDSQSGALRWPTLFEAATYASLRRRIDDLLASRTMEDSGAGSQNCVKTMAVLDALKSALRDNVRGYAAGDYLVARKFLDAVAVEIQRQAVPAAETLDRVAGR